LTSEDEPLVLEVVLDDFTDGERAAFPDTGPPETITIHLEGTIDPDDPSAVSVERRFPLAGHAHNISRVQFDAIGCDYVSATRSLATYEIVMESTFVAVFRIAGWCLTLILLSTTFTVKVYVPLSAFLGLPEMTPVDLSK
jgi:hypothetical protein